MGLKDDISELDDDRLLDSPPPVHIRGEAQQALPLRWLTSGKVMCCFETREAGVVNRQYFSVPLEEIFDPEIALQWLGPGPKTSAESQHEELLEKPSAKTQSVSRGKSKAVTRNEEKLSDMVWI